MRIERVRIDGFGRASEADLGLAPGVTVVSGLNGTGKTTLNAFIRAMLFGFGPGMYPAVRGGRRGGHLDIAMADGHRIRVERHGARGGRGDLNLLDDGTAPVAGDPHERLLKLLGGANRDVFEAIFAFGIDELADAGRLEGGEVSARIYGASLGASRSIIEIEHALREESDQLFRPRGRRQAINATLAQLAGIETALASRDVPHEYASLQVRATSVRVRLEALDREAAERSGERAASDRLVRAWPAWVELRTAEAELAALGSAPAVQDLLPEEARLAGAVATAEARHRQALEEIERRRVGLAEAPEPRRELLDAGSAIAPLSASAAGRDVEDRALAADRRRHDALAGDVAVAVADLGPGWNEARLRAAGSFIVQRDRLLARARDLLDAPAVALAEARSAASSAAREAVVAADEERELGASLAALPVDPRWSAEGLRATVDAADRAILESATARAASEAALADAALAEARETARRQGPRGTRVAVAAAAVLVLAVAAVAAVVAGPIAGALAGLVALIVAVVVARPGWAARVPIAPWSDGATTAGGSATTAQGGSSAARARAAGERLLAARALLDAALATLGLPPGTESVPLALRERVGDLVRVERDRAALERQHDAAATQAAFRRRAADDAAARLAEAEARIAAAQAGWDRVLATDGLPPLDPDALGRLLERAEAARTALRAFDELSATIETAQERRRGWERGVHDVLDPLGYAGPDCHGLIRVALADLQDAVRLDAARKSAAQALEAATREADASRELLTTAREEYRAFLARHGLADRADLEARHARATRGVALEVTRDRNRATIAALAGDAESPSELEGRLTATDGVAGPSVLRSQLDEALETLVRRRHALTTELGAVEQELRRVESETDTADLRQRRENALATLAQQADQYLVARLSVELIAAARARFERIHRPAVVAAAERLFVEWTGGEYAGLVVPFGERVQGARRADDGSLVRPPELSRGTREQLYLAFRFGLIEHYATQAEPLPIVMDEVLVNFDPERAERVGRSIRTLGDRHQVLYLTCHDRVPLEADREIVLGPNLQLLAVRDPLNPGGPPR